MTMSRFRFGRLLLLWQLCIGLVNCSDLLLVNTESGSLCGWPQLTFVNKKYYISYKGIPYAQPPIGSLRYREPVPIKPWNETILTTDKYPNSCIKVAQSQLTPYTNMTYSEDCLYLNVFTPVLDIVKVNKKLKVLFYIHGGGFTEGDGSNKYYGPDFIMEHNVVLVTINYRLGPFGFANFNRHRYTGNMGFKDQQLALKWVKKNIIYFGGDPNAITIVGQSAGAAAVHLHILGASCKYVNRAIILSGSAFNFWAHYGKNNHLDLLRETFKDDLGNKTTNEDVFNFMLTADVDVIVKKTPVLNLPNGVIEFIWSAVIEDESKATKPFLTKRPHNIYATNSLSNCCKHIEVLFGVTTAVSEYLNIFETKENLHGLAEVYKVVKKMVNMM